MSNPLAISLADLAQLKPVDALQIKAMLNIRQALLDVLGAYPPDNVLPYFYSFSRTTAKGNAIAANASVQDSIKITADSAFIGRAIAGASDGDFLTLIRTDASDRQLMNEMVHSSALMGTAERPGYLQKPLLLPMNSTLSFDITDLSGATNQLYFTIVGYKVYDRRVA